MKHEHDLLYHDLSTKICYTQVLPALRIIAERNTPPRSIASTAVSTRMETVGVHEYDAISHLVMWHPILTPTSNRLFGVVFEKWNYTK